MSLFSDDFTAGDVRALRIKINNNNTQIVLKLPLLPRRTVSKSNAAQLCWLVGLVLQNPGQHLATFY